MAETPLDVDAMIRRFQERAARVKDRSIPPVAGPERQRYIDQANLDYLDFALVGDAEGTLVDGVLTLRVDLRRPAASDPPPAGG
ncbi:MAG TPA: hypothetical protein VI916_07315 [Acidimicrobiia bacterium]|nr:hypothetical protein [Acidimicrobiia bacterium]